MRTRVPSLTSHCHLLIVAVPGFTVSRARMQDGFDQCAKRRLTSRGAQNLASWLVSVRPSTMLLLSYIEGATWWGSGT